ncbi:MAG: DEAD/DEAH box helicase family protein [Ardenticatenaceae bacterium]|nr:DEAD/DEAH box helicase family protein [Ardenticatenaceae bacterium]MCB9443376.1 DEAD/DEAH box helicase family protein [Ardenticatenaceae bacterium]
MSNFTFLQTEWPDIYKDANLAELFGRVDPRAACFYARRTLELTVNWLYDHDPAFRRPYSSDLSTLMTDDSFRRQVPTVVADKAHLIRKTGNIAVHSHRPIRPNDAHSAVRELFHVLYWLASTYTQGDRGAIPAQFDDSAIAPPPKPAKPQSPSQLQKLEAELRASDEALRQQKAEAAQTIAGYEAQIAVLKAQIASAKAVNAAIPDTHDYSEAETRQRLIDLLLREAGWDPHGHNVAEYKVQPMPNPRGYGYADYVLWGDDGLPLAVVEAKRASVEPQKGKQQAKLYADALEQMHGQRPIIFYTNGSKTWVWDDVRHYPPRAVQGFYNKAQLHLHIQRRYTAKQLANVSIEKRIVDRYYQEEAIRRLTERFSQSYRKGLVVMATGTGKTRVAIALVDLLMRANWVKRVLFLADRAALVRQAINAFKRYTPDANPINLVELSDKAEARNGRVVVSTYHTMINLIDQSLDSGEKLFGVGHFDLVIIDEAHRSVYQKFGAIFAYFDSLLLGLTATPRNEVDRNTYRLFELEDGVPTYDYDLDQAVADDYLVPPNPKSVPLKFIREGIKYDDLPDEQKEEWDLIEWDEEGNVPEAIEPAALNSWLFNQDTVDQVLKHLIENGLKVKGGDRLGKTIIFAKNHKHAQFIEERFDANYPHLAGHFARVIDNYQTYAHTLIDDFTVADKAPHIAISVDMLDTGIDVPEVVNLVFFKMVRSKTKFFQMLGRGTRLCPDLFGPDQDKAFFFVFDYCQNFEFFNQHPKGIEARLPEPLSQRIFKRRLELLEQANRLKQNEPAVVPLAQALADQLHQTVAAMNLDNFIVRPQRQYVEPFRDRSCWNGLSRSDLADLAHYVSGLPTQLAEEDETAKRFDLLVLQMQLALVEAAPRFEQLRDKVINIAQLLESKTSIPQVNAQLSLIQEVQTETYWENITLNILEDLRRRFRNLTKSIERQQQHIVYTDFTDELGLMHDAPGVYLAGGVNIAQYRKKVEQFIREREDFWVINKIRWAIPLEPDDLTALEDFFFQADETGSRDDFARAYPQQTSLPAFIRSLVGLDRKAAKEKFARFLDGSTYTADQIRFVNFIIDHLTRNGVMDPSLLYERPFTDIHYGGLSGVFPDDAAEELVAVVQAVNQSV